MPITAILSQQSKIPKPSNEILRMAILKCVKGKSLHKVCIQAGKTFIVKNVPESKI